MADSASVCRLGIIWPAVFVHVYPDPHLAASVAKLEKNSRHRENQATADVDTEEDAAAVEERAIVIAKNKRVRQMLKSVNSECRGLARLMLTGGFAYFNTSKSSSGVTKLELASVIALDGDTEVPPYHMTCPINRCVLQCLIHVLSETPSNTDDAVGDLAHARLQSAYGEKPVASDNIL